MSERKYLNMGWFGWTFTSIIVVTLIGSTVFFFNLFNLSPIALFSEDQGDGEKVSEETTEKVEEVRETVDEENSEVAQFTSDTHDFYNETTGYGGISSLDWEKQKDKAHDILEFLDQNKSTVSDEALSMDMEEIEALSNDVINETEADDVRYLHRMFHDLDIVLNDYKAYDKVWGSTETLKTTN